MGSILSCLRVLRPDSEAVALSCLLRLRLEVFFFRMYLKESGLGRLLSVSAGEFLLGSRMVSSLALWGVVGRCVKVAKLGTPKVKLTLRSLSLSSSLASCPCNDL